MHTYGAPAHAHASQLRRPRPGYRFGLRARAHARKLTPTFTQEDLMASRRPTEPPKEIPKVIQSDEKAAATSAPRVRAKAATPRVKKPTAKAPAAYVAVSEDVRRGMIAEGAYLRAERRGFAHGHEAEDWLAAEAEVDALLKARHGGTSQ
jgi:Protein of unknown function (DUF2934)